MSDRLQDARQPFARIDYGVMDRLPDFGPLALTVYAVLAMHSDPSTAICFPGRKTIAKEARMSERAVDAALKALVSSGCIRVTPRTTTTDSGAIVKTSNVYTLLTVPRKAEQVAPHGGACGAPGVGQDVPQGGAPGAHRTRTIEQEPKEQDKDIAPHVTAQPSPSAPKPSSKPAKPPTTRAPRPMFDAFMAAFPKAPASLAGRFDAACSQAGLTLDRWHAFMADRKVRESYTDGFLTRNNAGDRFHAWAKTSATRRDPTREAGDNGASLAARNEAFLKAKGWA